MPNPDLPYVVLDQRAFAKAKVDEKTAEDAVAELLPVAVDSLNLNPLPELKLVPPTVPHPVATGCPQRRMSSTPTRGCNLPRASCRPRSGES